MVDISSKSKRVAPNGWYWCNVYLKDSKPKLVAAELLEEKTEKQERKFKLWSNSSKMEGEKGWIKSGEKVGWFFRIAFESEINAFFDY